MELSSLGESSVIRGQGPDTERVLKHLFTCSKAAVKSFQLKQQEISQNLRKVAEEAWKEAAKAEALFLLAQIVDQQGEELIARDPEAIEIGETESVQSERAVTTQPGPQHWRTEVRRLRRAG